MNNETFNEVNRLAQLLAGNGKCLELLKNLKSTDEITNTVSDSRGDEVGCFNIKGTVRKKFTLGFRKLLTNRIIELKKELEFL